KDKHKKEEDKSKGDRLDEIIARIRPRIKSKTKHGMPDGAFRAMLAEMRIWYRLTRLEGSGVPDITVRATLNPGPRDVETVHQVRDEDPGDPVDYDDAQQDEDPGPSVKENDPIIARRGPNWFDGVVTRAWKKKFEFFGHGEPGADRFNITKRDNTANVKTRGYSPIWKPAPWLKKFKLGEEFEKIRHRDSWGDWKEYEGRQILNFRRHGKFTEHSGNYSWHHIVEQSSGLPNKDINQLENLTYTTNSWNSKFSGWMGGRRQRSDPKKTTIMLPDTKNLPLRDYLRAYGIKYPQQKAWGLRCIEETLGIGVRPQWYVTHRGRFQELL
ncbi:hypothetical protein, partial [Streptomyces sp. RKCA744]